MVTLEHRFFGASLPSNVENLTERYKTLMLDNVLLDSVDFVEWVKRTVPGAKDSKVIAFGGTSYPSISGRVRRRMMLIADWAMLLGSYAGTLSTLLRMNYPDTFWAAMNFVAPVRGLGYGNPEGDKFWIWVRQACGPRDGTG